jgi:alpha-amylase family protein
VKKLTSLLLTLLLTFNFAAVEAVAIDSIQQKEVIKQEENAIIPSKLEKEIKTSLAKVYGQDNVEVMYSNILEIAKKAKEQRSLSLLEDDLNRKSDWYKDEVIYMFYANHFGVKSLDKNNTFKDDIEMLDYLKGLGVTTIYILPFVDSPMEDAGFDIRNPRDIRADLGGMFEFQKFLSAARAKGFKIKADLVLNHLSDQHEWFQQALKGDTSKINYFVVREQMPEYTKYKDPKLGWVAEYKEANGKTSKRRIIFPEITENNYRKVTINNKDYYFYHTFYPFQLDINWENPKVLYYNLETIAFWANQGVDIFRMDAIPYLIKEDGTNAENLEETHRIIKILSAFIQAVAPRSVIQAEACQMPNKILPYFGTERKFKDEIKGKEKEITRTDEVQIAYHFPYMPAIWASLVTADNSYFWKAYKQTPQIPETASWALFLRVHDELTLEMVNQKTRELIFDDLAPKGAAFRKGFGVSGRMANFLDNNPDRIGMAFSILMSLPGIPIIYYGDEIGIQNNFANAKKSAKLRENKQKSTKSIKNNVSMLSYFDSRDINRGPITQKTFEDAVNNKGTYNNKVYERVKQLIKVRKQYPVITRGSFVELKTKSPEVFAYVRATDEDRVVVINNLSDKKIKATVLFTDDNFGKKGKDIYLKDLLTDKMIRAKVENKELSVRLNAYDALWLKM